MASGWYSVESPKYVAEQFGEAYRTVYDGVAVLAVLRFRVGFSLGVGVPVGVGVRAGAIGNSARPPPRLAAWLSRPVRLSLFSTEPAATGF